MDGDPTHQELTPQETQVLRLAAEGAHTRAISTKLGITTNTVRTELRSIMQKLGVHSRVEAVASHTRSDQDAELCANLRRLPARDREALLRWLLAAEEDRENIASQALKRREGGDTLAEHIATLTTHPEQHERFIRLLREIESADG